MVSKAYRLEVFLDRLLALPPSANFVEARAQLEATLNAVEDEHSGVPYDPSSWRSDGRMYPPQDDRMYDVPEHPSVKKLRTVGHVIYIGANGAIRIEGKFRHVFVDKSGADGKKVFDP